MKYELIKLPAYLKWFSKEPKRSQLQVIKRLNKIENEGHFGHINNLEEGLLEIKFTDGRRIYYVIIPKDNVVLIL